MGGGSILATFLAALRSSFSGIQRIWIFWHQEIGQVKYITWLLSSNEMPRMTIPTFNCVTAFTQHEVTSRSPPPTARKGSYVRQYRNYRPYEGDLRQGQRPFQSQGQTIQWTFSWSRAGVTFFIMKSLPLIASQLGWLRIWIYLFRHLVSII